MLKIYTYCLLIDTMLCIGSVLTLSFLSFQVRVLRSPYEWTESPDQVGQLVHAPFVARPLFLTDVVCFMLNVV